jgi:hypothetical protein
MLLGNLLPRLAVHVAIDDEHILYVAQISMMLADEVAISVCPPPISLLLQKIFNNHRL